MPEKQKKNSISINKYKTKRELNIGTLIFALIFIYLVVAVVAYATEKRDVYKRQAQKQPVRSGDPSESTGGIFQTASGDGTEAEGFDQIF